MVFILVLTCDKLQTVSPHTVKVKAHEVNSFVKDPKHATQHVSTVTWRVQLGTVGVEAFAHDDFSVESTTGGLRLKSEKPRTVTIFSLNGHRVAHLNVCGEEQVRLPKGLYIVEGKKMIVD